MSVLALDIGGANLKAVHSAGGAREVVFALWERAGELGDRLGALSAEMGAAERWLVTMTGEMCDCFAGKREGVRVILEAVRGAAGKVGVREVGVWTTGGEMVSVERAMGEPLTCAAANWHALGTWAGREYTGGATVVIDTGSTTTDVMYLRGGRLAAVGLTDTDRLASGELVYIGARRTGVMGLGRSVLWRGREVGLMNELFATTGDVFCLTGDARGGDEADRDEAGAAARLVRMIGGDLEGVGVEGARELARALAGMAVGGVSMAVTRVVAGRAVDRVVVSGSGAFVAEAAAHGALAGVAVERLAERIGEAASVAACAYALCRLGECEGAGSAGGVG